MKVLLTGANGYIGKRLLYLLLERDLEVVCCVRDAGRFNHALVNHPQLTIIEADFLKPDTLNHIPQDIDAAYYLMHAMSVSGNGFEDREKQMAQNFLAIATQRSFEQVIYLGGIANDNELSPHLRSRLNTEKILSRGPYNFTALRAGIIVGSGSGSFEIIRDLVEKLPLMIAPRWLKTKSQPIAVNNILEILDKTLLNKALYNKTFDIAGPEVMSYKEMLLRFARVRGLRRLIVSVPVLTPRLSSYWLYFVTSTSYGLARHLVESMKTEVIAKPNTLTKQLDIELITYEEAVRRAFSRIKQNQLISSWKDAMSSETINKRFEDLVEVPSFGCFKDHRQRPVTHEAAVLNNLWSIGGERGWYYGNWLWKLRGLIDKMVGGVGLRRGRTHPTAINSGDSLDFWRVIVADKTNKRLLLFAEMKLPGDAWLEFKIDKHNVLHQTATFRPKGIWGRLYWLAVWPFHGFVFNGMISGIAQTKSVDPKI
ncbi:SDR family oxidoreductase [Roseivirga sp. UBA1976]|uniref:SDR family oxidoreductase n=1 Tax=Roseivirga sp. UBA1976 TaxID=1947386 RepID=UPI00257C93B8|nr:SDR family oxidoreductase [Roseivirga sp. UBA1976]MEC7754554.1 SDR family oxidoreductase [Bacteroidota bacterium]